MKHTLNTLISDEVELTAEQKDSLYRMLSGRIRQPTRVKLRRRIDMPISLWPNYGIFGRVMLEDDGQFSYCAGQDYPSEIALVRKLLLEG